MLGALHATGRPGRRGDAGPGGGARPDRDASADRTRAALAALFEPERARLRLTPDEAAGLVMGPPFAGTRARRAVRARPGPSTGTWTCSCTPPPAGGRRGRYFADASGDLYEISAP